MNDTPSPQGSEKVSGTLPPAGKVPDTFSDPQAQRDVFDEVFALLTPDRLLRDPRATGEGVTVCVIDSGVEQLVLEERCRQRGESMQPVIGGIFTRNTGRNLDQVPFFGDIPILGILFQRRRANDQRNELVVEVRCTDRYLRLFEC